MDYIGDASELVRRIRVAAFGGSLPEELAFKLQTIPGSPADLLIDGAEVLYAYRDHLDERGLELLGQLYCYADQQGWSTFNQDGRSAAIVRLVRRDLGETSDVAAPDAEWPAPDSRRRDGIDWRQSTADTQLVSAS